MKSWSEVLYEVNQELRSAKEKFPDFHSAHEGFAVLKEELDEAWDAIRVDDVEAAKREMIQVAAMAVRFITDL